MIKLLAPRLRLQVLPEIRILTLLQQVAFGSMSTPFSWFEQGAVNGGCNRAFNGGFKPYEKYKLINQAS